jgi:hypothetical protein
MGQKLAAYISNHFGGRGSALTRLLAFMPSQQTTTKFTSLFRTGVRVCSKRKFLILLFDKNPAFTTSSPLKVIKPLTGPDTKESILFVHRPSGDIYETGASELRGWFCREIFP